MSKLIVIVIIRSWFGRIAMLFLLDGQMCIDSADIQLDGNDQIDRSKSAIVPYLNFTCNGRITRINAKLSRRTGTFVFPYLHVWRPISPSSVFYNRIHEVQLQSFQFTLLSNTRIIINIILTGNERREFQSGDVIGYYHPSNSRYQVRTIRTDGYVQYEFDGSPTSVNLSTVPDDDVTDQRQPLIEYTVGQPQKFVLFVLSCCSYLFSQLYNLCTCMCVVCM